MSHRILLVSHVPPVPTNTGGNQRTNLLHRALAALGEVDLLLLRDESEVDPADLATLRERYGLRACVPRLPRGRRWPWRLVRPLRPSLVDRAAGALGRERLDFAPEPALADAARRLVAERGHAVAVVRYLRSAGKVDLFGRLPVAIDVDDVDDEVLRSRLERDDLSPVRRLALRRQLASIDGVIDPLARRASVRWIAKPSDRRRPALRDAAVLPNIPFVREGEAAPAALPLQRESRTLLVVGTLWHRPNHDAIDRFLARSWAEVLARAPEARLRIVGLGMTDEQRRRWSTFAGVEPIGFVEDLSAEYRRCALALCTVQEGGGTNIKVAEAYAFARPCVLSPHAFRGYEGALAAQDSPEPSAWVGATDVDIAAGCVRLLGDPELRDAMARRGRAACAERLSFATFAAIVARDVAPLLDPRGARIHGDAHDTRPS